MPRGGAGETKAMKAFCFLLFAWHVAAQTHICSHDYYDIDSLRKLEYWQFKVPDPKLCINGTNDDECIIYFGVCQSVPNEQCPVPYDDTGVCMQVYNATDHPGYNYDFGRSEFEIIEDNLTNLTGFVITYNSGQKLPNCKSGTKAIVFFQCNIDNEWNLNDHDVTPHLDGFVANPFDECQLMIYLNYSGACVKQIPVIPDICSLDPYDILTLSNPIGWNAVVDKKYCFTTDNNTVGSSCNLLFSFCKPLPSGQCYNSVFCQDPESSNSLTFGSYNKHITVSENEDGEGFTITNYNGSKTDKCPDGLFSTLIFICNKTAKWTDDTGNPIQDITQFITPQPDIDNCQYIVRFNYSGACGGTPPKPTGSSNTKKQLSNILGWILLAVFCVALLYIIVGVVIQAARGKKGAELIPNHTLWRAFFIYVLEGGQVTLDVITCRYCLKKSISKVDYEKL